MHTECTEAVLRDVQPTSRSSADLFAWLKHLYCKNYTSDFMLYILVRDEIKSSGKFAIRSSFKIARTPSLPPSILITEFPHPKSLNKKPKNVCKWGALVNEPTCAKLPLGGAPPPQVHLMTCAQHNTMSTNCQNGRFCAAFFTYFARFSRLETRYFL